MMSDFLYISAAMSSIGVGVAIGVIALKWLEYQHYLAAEKLLRTTSESMSKEHNKLVEQMTELADQITHHEILIKGAGNGVPGFNRKS